MPKPLPTIVETAAYQLACASRKFDPARLERARDLLIDPRTTVLPDGTIDFPSETAGFRVLPLVGDGQLKFCDCPDRRRIHSWGKHDIARMLLYRASTLRVTGRVIYSVED